MKRNDILKDYYSFTVRFGGRDNSFKERVKNFFKRNNFFGKMNKDIDCLEIAEDIIKDFRRDRYFSEYDYMAYDENGKSYMAHNHPDPFQLRARNALVNGTLVDLVMFLTVCMRETTVGNLTILENENMVFLKWRQDRDSIKL